MICLLPVLALLVGPARPRALGGPAGLVGGTGRCGPARAPARARAPANFLNSVVTRNSLVSRDTALLDWSTTPLRYLLLMSGLSDRPSVRPPVHSPSVRPSVHCWPAGWNGMGQLGRPDLLLAVVVVRLITHHPSLMTIPPSLLQCPGPGPAPRQWQSARMVEAGRCSKVGYPTNKAVGCWKWRA